MSNYIKYFILLLCIKSFIANDKFLKLDEQILGSIGIVGQYDNNLNTNMNDNLFSKLNIQKQNIMKESVFKYFSIDFNATNDKKFIKQLDTIFSKIKIKIGEFKMNSKETIYYGDKIKKLVKEYHNIINFNLDEKNGKIYKDKLNNYLKLLLKENEIIKKDLSLQLNSNLKYEYDLFLKYQNYILKFIELKEKWIIQFFDSRLDDILKNFDNIKPDNQIDTLIDYTKSIIYILNNNGDYSKNKKKIKTYIIKNLIKNIIEKKKYKNDKEVKFKKDLIYKIFLLFDTYDKDKNEIEKNLIINLDSYKIIYSDYLDLIELNHFIYFRIEEIINYILNSKISKMLEKDTLILFIKKIVFEIMVNNKYKIKTKDNKFLKNDEYKAVIDNILEVFDNIKDFNEIKDILKIRLRLNYEEDLLNEVMNYFVNQKLDIKILTKIYFKTVKVIYTVSKKLNTITEKLTESDKSKYKNLKSYLLDIIYYNKEIIKFNNKYNNDPKIKFDKKLNFIINNWLFKKWIETRNIIIKYFINQDFINNKTNIDINKVYKNQLFNEIIQKIKSLKYKKIINMYLNYFINKIINNFHIDYYDTLLYIIDNHIEDANLVNYNDLINKLNEFKSLLKKIKIEELKKNVYIDNKKITLKYGYRENDILKFLTEIKNKEILLKKIKNYNVFNTKFIVAEMDVDKTYFDCE